VVEVTPSAWPPGDEYGNALPQRIAEDRSIPSFGRHLDSLATSSPVHTW